MRDDNVFFFFIILEFAKGEKAANLFNIIPRCIKFSLI